MYELLVLSLLMRWPLHGYLIVKMANNIIGPEENISRGTLSTLLAKMERARLVTLAGEGTASFPSNHTPRVYMITPEGKKRFEQLMLEIPEYLGAYSRLFHIKALHLDLLPLDKHLMLVEHYLQYCLGLIRGKETDMADFSSDAQKRAYAADPHLRETAASLMQLKARQWEQEAEWARQLLAQVQASAKPVERTREN